MRVAITSRGPDVDSEVDPRFGRARYLVVIDTETGEVRAHDNSQNVNAMQGAGIQAAQHVVSHGAEAVLTGHLGPKAFRALQAAKVSAYTGVSGTVREAVDRLRAGELARATSPDVLR